MSKITSILALILVSLSLAGQEGFIRGRVFDGETGEYLPGVTVFVEGTTKGTITDLDGNFNLSISAGNYNVRISFISYETVNIQNLEVKAGEASVIGEVELKYATLGINEVTVTADRVRNTDNALNSIKVKSANLMDGISATSLTRIGDSDAASSMKRVTGVSVEGGKYVYVRGLGDRYTKTLLNGVDIPGLDPDRNTLQMDIFPTSIINNIIVHKSFSADLPADFTGGVVDIEIKDFPSGKEGGISLSSGFNPDFHFRNDYLDYEGGNTDFLGFDDGTRAIPAEENIPPFALVVGDPEGENATRYKEILDGFNPNMSAIKQRSFMDYGFGVSLGNQLPKGKHTLGYNIALSYKNDTEFYQNTVDARYGLKENSIYEMEVRERQTGSYGVNNTLLNGMAGMALKTSTSKYRFYLLHLQNGERKAGVFDFTGSDQGSDFESVQHNLEYSQRSLTNLLIDGKHKKGKDSWEVEWKLSPTLSLLNDPDIRFSRYEVTDGGGVKIGTEVGFPERIWRELSEINLAGTAHASKKILVSTLEMNLKFGGAYTFKHRDYSIRKFLLNVRGGDGVLPLTGDPDELLSDELKWPYNGNVNYGTGFDTDFSRSNQYNASVSYSAAYVSTEFKLFSKLKSILGVRMESYLQNYTGQNQLGSEVLDNERVLNDLSLFPSVNFVYELGDRQNLRFSFSNTIARPSMKELSFAEIYDPISGRTFIGGLHPDRDNVSGVEYWDGNLSSTRINNLDLRWERFFDNAQMFSLSGFYKTFRDPIELVQFATQTGAFQPRNVGDGEVFGIETEFKADLTGGFSINNNVTLTRSRIRLSLTEYESRVENARVGEEVDEYRAMAGQAPFIVNTGLSYEGREEKFQAGLFYHVKGTTLEFAGINDRPDIWTTPFHSLNFNSSLKFGGEGQFKAGLKITNILDADRESVYRSYKAEDQLFEFRDPGRSFSLSFKWSFF